MRVCAPVCVVCRRVWPSLREVSPARGVGACGRLAQLGRDVVAYLPTLIAAVVGSVAKGLVPLKTLERHTSAAVSNEKKMTRRVSVW
jgi:hypothetical protein